MSRFEIEDIVSQDKRGIVFRAHDTEKGHTVALRRFFPFGQDGGGLKEEEAVAFRIAAQRLEGVAHTALRSVFSGAVDPIDNMPYMVVEWVDGAKLDDVLAGENLDPRLVIQILHLALEVSILLSEVLGEEAVWIETDSESIYVGSGESGRGFVFWLSPFKWLGAEFGTRKLAAIVDLGERLAGWKGKLIGDHAGFGLGGWLKWMRNNPDASLAQALEALPAFISDGDSPPPAKPTLAPPVAVASVVQVKPPSSASPIIIAACAALLLAVGGLLYYRSIMAQDPVIPPPYVEQKISQPQSDQASVPPPAPANAEQPAPPPAPSAEPPAVVAAPEVKPKPAPQPPPEPSGEAEAISAARVKEMAEKLAKEKEAERAAALAPPVTAAPPVRDFTPGDTEKMSALKANGSASVTGVILNVRLSSTGNSLYFEFSKPTNANEIMVVAHKREYRDEFTIDAYKDLIGKKVRFDGTVFREPTGKQYVKISGRARMKEVK